MNKKKFMTTIVIILVVIASISFNIDKKPEINSHNYFNPKSIVMGELKYDLNFENAVTKLASHIIVGTPVEIHELNTTYDIMDIQVKECLMGDFKSEKISVRARKGALNINNSYILFINAYDSPLFKNELYTLLSEYVMKIEEDNSILLIENPVENKYIKPFKSEKYNNLGFVKDYINKIKNTNVHKNKEKVMNKASDINQLILISDNIFEITVTNVENIQSMNDNTMLSSVSYVINKKYKGDIIDNQHTIILPGNVSTGKEYLLFFKKKDESIVLATREGSIVEVGSKEYNKYIKSLEN